MLGVLSKSVGWLRIPGPGCTIHHLISSHLHHHHQCDTKSYLACTHFSSGSLVSAKYNLAKIVMIAQ